MNTNYNDAQFVTIRRKDILEIYICLVLFLAFQKKLTTLMGVRSHHLSLLKQLYNSFGIWTLYTRQRSSLMIYTLEVRVLR